MISSTVVMIICIAGIWMTSRVLTVRQALRYRRQLMQLREQGRLSVGMAKKFARRVYVGLTYDTSGVVTAGLVLRGATVFASGQPEPRLVGCRAVDLADGLTPPGLSPMVVTAAAQSATFLIDSRPTLRTSRPRRRPATVAA